MNFSEFEEKIGYSFKDKTLLELALTHSSYANENKLKKTISSKSSDYAKLCNKDTEKASSIIEFCKKT